MKKPYILRSCVITFLCTTVYANKVSDVDPTIKIVESYINLINSIEEDNSATKVLDLYSKQYSGNTTYVKLSGAIIKKNYTKEDIKIQLDDILEDENYSLKVKMNKVLYNQKKESAGTISVLLDFESFIDNKVAEKVLFL